MYTRKHHPTRSPADDGFLCKHCRAIVSPAGFPSGVRNRNHCPYCLWSRHLDLQAAGDRLSACKSPMEPIGLTVKATRKKYGPGRGELMLVHACIECGKVSINRIAADDHPGTILAVFEGSSRLDASTRTRLEAGGIRALTSLDGEVVQAQLFGQGSGLAKALFTSGLAAPRPLSSVEDS